MRPLNVQLHRLFSARYDARGVEPPKVRCSGLQKPGGYDVVAGTLQLERGDVVAKLEV